MNGVRLFWNDAEKPGNKGSADQRMSCARPWTYSISFLALLRLVWEEKETTA